VLEGASGTPLLVAERKGRDSHRGWSMVAPWPAAG